MAREVTVQGLEGLGDVQLVDVRTVEEREAGRIPGDSAHIPFHELAARAGEIEKEKTVVFYCRSGDRSGSAADAFEASGFDAVNLAGGIVAWEEAGKPVEGQVGQPSGLPPR